MFNITKPCSINQKMWGLVQETSNDKEPHQRIDYNSSSWANSCTGMSSIAEFSKFSFRISPI